MKLNRKRFRAVAGGGASLYAAVLLTTAACSSDESGPSPTGTEPQSASMTPGTPAPGAMQAGSAMGTATPGQPNNTTAGSAQEGPDFGRPTEDPGMTAETPAQPPAGMGGPEQPPMEMETPGMPAETPAEVPMGPSEWTQMGFDAASTFFNRNETKLTKENAANLKEAWTADMGGPVYGAPLMVGDTMYASSTARVAAFDVASGDQKWMSTPGTTGSIAYADGTLYVHTARGQVLALDASDGSQKWSKQPDSQTGDGSSSPLIAGDFVLVGGASGTRELLGGGFRGYLAALNRTSGDVAWVTHTVPDGTNGASIWSSPSADVAAGVAYGSTGNNYGPPASDTSDAIIAFDLMTGDIKWKAQRVENDTFGGGSFGGGPDHDFGANPVLYETMVDGQMTQLVSAGAKSGSAHAVRRDDGSLVWTRSLGRGTATGSSGIFVNSTWAGKNMLFAQNEEGKATLYALDGATGDIAWQRSVSGSVWGRITVANGVGLVGVGETLQVFDVDSGDVIKDIPSKGGTVACSISVANGRVAFGDGFTWQNGKPGRTLHVLSVE